MDEQPAPSDGSDEALALFEAEASYAQSIFCRALGDIAGCIEAGERSLAWKPGYPPAVLTMGSIEYQRGTVQGTRERATARSRLLARRSTSNPTAPT